MRKVFADTGFWIALLNPRDSLHSKSREFDASPEIEHVVTTEMVLSELLNDLGARGPGLRTAVSRFVQALRSQPGVLIVQQTSDQFWQAAALFAERIDKARSLTDCASFVVMQECGLHEALTHDRHFEQMGFIALLRQ